MKKYLLVSILMVAATNYSYAGSSTSAKEIAWTYKGKEAVKLKLKDANSAKFRNVYFSRGRDNIPMTCGEVNSKNSFGGYTGFKKFISAGEIGLTFLQSEISDFHTVWNRMCR